MMYLIAYRELRTVFAKMREVAKSQWPKDPNVQQIVIRHVEQNHMNLLLTPSDQLFHLPALLLPRNSEPKTVQHDARHGKTSHSHSET